MMKLVVAIVKPFKLDSIRRALAEQGVPALTVSEIKGFGSQENRSNHYRGTEYNADFLPKLKIEVAVEDAQVDVVVETIVNAAHTGKLGDGKVYVEDLQQMVHIHTGEIEGGL